MINAKCRQPNKLGAKIQQVNQKPTACEKTDKQRQPQPVITRTQHHKQTDNRQSATQRRKLPQHIIAECFYENFFIFPADSRLFIHAGISFASDIKNKVVKGFYRAIKIRRHRVKRPPNHPRIWRQSTGGKRNQSGNDIRQNIPQLRNHQQTQTGRA